MAEDNDSNVNDPNVSPTTEENVSTEPASKLPTSTDRTDIVDITSPGPPPVEVTDEPNTPPSTSDEDVGDIEKGIDTNNAIPTTESSHDVSSSDTAQQTIDDEVIATQSLAIAKGNALLEQDDDKHEENVQEIVDIEKGTSTGATSYTEPPSTTTQTSSQVPPATATIMGSSPPSDSINIQTTDQVQPGAIAILGPSGHTSNIPANRPRGNPIMDAPVSDPTPILEAMRVEDDTNEVYEATEVTERPWWKKNRYIYGGMGLLVGAALALGLSLGLNGGSSNKLTEDLSPTQSPYPSLSPTSSSAPSPVIYFKQLGQDINGKEGMDLLGGSVSMSSDGKILAVSAGQMGNNGPGYVTVYKWNETLLDYEPFGETLTGDAAGDGFGYSSSVSEDAQTLVIGAPFHDMNGENSGHVKVYMWNETALSYNQVGDTLYGTNKGDTFGEVVATSADGKTVVVSSTGGDANGEDSGQVTLYKWDENASNYEQVDTLLGDAAGDSFGYSISLSSNGKTLAVGSPFKDVQTNGLSSGSTKGQVKLFVWDDESLNYRPAATLSAEKTHQFGWSVSLSEDSSRLAVGLLDLGGTSSFNDENVDTAGKVMVYELNLNEELLQYKQLGELSGDFNKDDFGASVFLDADGKTLVVGAPKDDKNGIQSGSAKVFEWDEATLSYTQLYDSAVYGEGPDNYFGGPVSIARDGKTFAVGAIGNGKNGPYSGQLQVFSIPSEDEESNN